MNDNGLGKDNVILMEKWNQKRKDQEAQERYNNTIVSFHDYKKKKYSKKDMKEEKIDVRKLFYILAGVLVVTCIGVKHHECKHKIYDKVMETGIIPKNLGITDNSTGYTITYPDYYGNVQNMGADYFSQMIVEKGKEVGLSPDMVAIALEYGGVLGDASAIEESSLLGRIGEEIKVSWNIDEQIEKAVGKPTNASSMGNSR